jgi:hypothetical protein
MDFADSPEHTAFRAELRRWLDENSPLQICAGRAGSHCRASLPGQPSPLAAEMRDATWHRERVARLMSK